MKQEAGYDPIKGFHQIVLRNACKLAIVEYLTKNLGDMSGTMLYNSMCAELPNLLIEYLDEAIKNQKVKPSKSSLSTYEKVKIITKEINMEQDIEDLCNYLQSAGSVKDLVINIGKGEGRISDQEPNINAAYNAACAEYVIDQFDDDSSPIWYKNMCLELSDLLIKHLKILSIGNHQ